MLHAVIMAGGAGTRFWPMSRAALPKQMLALVTERPLLADTVERLEGLIPGERVHVITNAAYAESVRALLRGVPARQVVAEPCGRDTAPCIGLAAVLIARQDPAAVMAVLPADHVVHPPQVFQQALARAAAVVEERPGALITFGITPTRPAVGYGYIERGAELGRLDGIPFFKVDSFREKPNLRVAREFLAAGRFSWNAGIFVFRAQAILERIERHLPELAAALPALADAYLRQGAIPESAYRLLPRISIDYGVFERDEDVVMLEASFTWDDVGSFAALERVLPKDAQGNCGVGLSTLLDARRNIVVSGKNHRIALIGVEGLIVVHSDDATLVCRAEDAERVKELVNLLQSKGLADLL